MNVLEYIENLMDQGLSEDDAGRCVDCLYSDEWESEDDYGYYRSDIDDSYDDGCFYDNEL